MQFIGLRVLNPSSLPMDNQREAQKIESKQGSVLAPADPSGKHPYSGNVLWMC